MNSEYIQALIARIEAGKNKLEDFSEVIQERIIEQQEIKKAEDGEV